MRIAAYLGVIVCGFLLAYDVCALLAFWRLGDVYAHHLRAVRFALWRQHTARATLLCLLGLPVLPATMAGLSWYLRRSARTNTVAGDLLPPEQVWPPSPSYVSPTDGERRPMSKPAQWAVFLATAYGLYFFLLMLWFFVCFDLRVWFHLSRSFGHSVGGPFLMALFIPSLGISAVLCWRLGLAGLNLRISVEAIRRGESAGTTSVHTVELVYPRSYWSGLAMVFGMFALITLAIVWALPGTTASHICGYAAVGLFGLIVAFLSARGLLGFGGYFARADAQGITSHGKWIGWEQIAACEIIMMADASGEPAPTLCRLKDAAGKIVMNVSLVLGGFPLADRLAFVQALRVGMGAEGRVTELTR